MSTNLCSLTRWTTQYTGQFDHLLICSHIIIQILQNYAVDSTQPGREGGLAAWGQRLAGVPWCLLQPAQGRTAWDIFGLAYLDWIWILSRSSEPGAPLSKTNSSVIINQRIWTATRSVSVQAEKPKEPFCVEREMCGHMNRFFAWENLRWVVVTIQSNPYPRLNFNLFSLSFLATCPNSLYLSFAINSSAISLSHLFPIPAHERRSSWNFCTPIPFTSHLVNAFLWW